MAVVKVEANFTNTIDKMFFQSKVFVLVLLALTISVFGVPNHETVQDSELSENDGTSHRTKRQVIDAIKIVLPAVKPALDHVGGLIGDAIKGKCANKGGCHKGYCWSKCRATGIGGEWCYNTKGRSQDYKYVKCSRDSECDKCWKCAGSCTI